MRHRFAYRLGLIASMALAMAIPPTVALGDCAMGRSSGCCCRQGATGCCCCRSRTSKPAADEADEYLPLVRKTGCRCADRRSAIPPQQPPRLDRQCLDVGPAIPLERFVCDPGAVADPVFQLFAPPAGNRRQALLCVWRD